jgi:hypothetical protein
MPVQRKVPKVQLDRMAASDEFALRCQHDCEDCRYNIHNQRWL